MTPFLSIHDLPKYQPELDAFWKTGQVQSLLTRDGVRLHTVYFQHPQPIATCLLVNGRTESVVKYAILFYELYRRGYNIISYDHRGQGLSDRLISDATLGHVNDFNDYVHDLQEIVKLYLPSLKSTPINHMIAHSMGGLVASMYLHQESSHLFDSLVLSSPMMGIHLPRWLKPLAFGLAKQLSLLPPLPVPGHTLLPLQSFQNNILMSCPTYFNWVKNLYSMNPSITLGSASFHWINHSQRAFSQFLAQPIRYSIPVLLLQSGLDSLVDNDAQLRFMQQLKAPWKGIWVSPNALHEVFFEQDSYRTPALQQLLQFQQSVQESCNILN